MQNRKAPTMKDVAIEAGVSIGTVSKIFNGVSVGEEYKRKVDQAAEKLGYHVNAYARGLRSNKTNTVAIIMPNLFHPFYATFVDCSCKILHSHGYKTLVATTAYNPETEQECMDMVMHNKVDGIIALTYNPNLEVSEGIPFVIIDRKFKSHIPCVCADNFNGGELAAQKLIENGCKKLLFLNIASHVPGEADKRLLGFQQYCKSNDIDHEIKKVFDEDGQEAIFDYLENLIKNNAFNFDGIFCNTDSLAVQVISLLKRRGISIPEQVQIIGFDGVKQFESDEYYCSTIAQPIQAMSEVAVNTVLNYKANNNQALICLPVEYKYGGTTKK